MLVPFFDNYSNNVTYVSINKDSCVHYNENCPHNNLGESALYIIGRKLGIDRRYLQLVQGCGKKIPVNHKIGSYENNCYVRCKDEYLTTIPVRKLNVDRNGCIDLPQNCLSCNVI